MSSVPEGLIFHGVEQEPRAGVAHRADAQARLLQFEKALRGPMRLEKGMNLAHRQRNSLLHSDMFFNAATVAFSSVYCLPS